MTLATVIGVTEDNMWHTRYCNNFLSELQPIHHYPCNAYDMDEGYVDFGEKCTIFVETMLFRICLYFLFCLIP